MKIPEELKNKIKSQHKEYKKLKDMQPNRQIGRAMYEVVHSGDLHKKMIEHPRMIQLLEEHDRIMDSKPVWDEAKFIAFQEKYYKKARKILNSILTEEDYITILEETLKYTPGELKQLELYEESEDYWTDRL